VHTRREFAILASAGALAGCSATTGGGAAASLLIPSPPTPPRRTRLALTPVAVAPERVIRTVTGLRPFRPAGFVVRAEPLGDKRLVHNYGHGGGGVTLSWGTSDMAVRLGHRPDVRDYAVLGCGAVGLATARLLQRRGGRVTIYARELPPETTSNIAGAQWWPTSLFDRSAVTPEFMRDYALAAHLSYRHFQNLVGAHYGVRWTRNYIIGNRALSDYPAGPDDPLRSIAPELRDLAPGEHPFDAAYVRQWDTMMVEPPVYLQAMVEDFLSAGGTVSVRAFADRSEVAALPERVVFNCTGLGARALFGDEALVPVKGQLVVLLPQAEVNYNLLNDGLYMFPRADGIMLGGTFERGNWSLDPDPADTARILAGHRAIFDAMDNSRVRRPV
jgi:glycine/D-amino acid oxidase-like deaminating enzyme